MEPASGGPENKAAEGRNDRHEAPPGAFKSPLPNILWPEGGVRPNWLTLSFPKDVEEEYQEKYFFESLPHVRLSILLSIFFYGIFGVLDAWILPEITHELWFIRYAIFIPYCVLLFAFTYSRHFKKYLQLCVSTLILLAGVGIVVMIQLAPYPANYLYYGGVILCLIFGYTFFKVRFIWAAATGWVMILAYEIAAVSYGKTPGAILLNHNFFYLTANIMGMFACYSIEFYQRKDFIQANLLQEEREKVGAANQELERRVEKRTSQLVKANVELMQEIEDRWRAEEALKESEERFRSLSEQAPDIIFTLDSEGRFAYVNPAWERLIGDSPEDVKGRSFINFCDGESHFQCLRVFKRITTHRETVRDIEGDLKDKKGRVLHFAFSGSPDFDSTGRMIGIIGMLRDITERRVTEEQLRYMVYHDPLTGLYNRKAFYDRLEDRIAQSYRSATGQWALLFLDLDRFKDVNDTLGHDVGDELLVMASERISDTLRKSDYVYRLGGDEFTIITGKLATGLDASLVANRILEIISEPFHIRGFEIYVTASVGISLFPHDGETVDILIKHADLAMYDAKQDGNCCRFFASEMNERALTRMHLDSNLRQAIRKNQFALHYQPMVDDNGKLVSVEALIRWIHPEMGMVSPDQFIPLAEETGFILPIGEWVLRTACHQIKDWAEEGLDDIYVAVNLSARQLKQPDLVEMVRDILDETGIQPESLHLEITETSVMDDPEEAIAKMQLLHDMGIRFSMDDFGTGYSSLSYLKKLPVTTLKIDRSFVRDAASNIEDQEIIRTIISMARNLKMETLAEGVEELAQKEFLSAQGCKMMQGFYFGKPMPGDQIQAWLAESRELAAAARRH